MTPKKKKLKKKQWIGLVFIAPWLIGLIGLQVYPFVASLFYSFTEYNIMSSPKWIGLANYVKLFTADNEFWYSVKVTLIYTIFTVPGKLTVALIVALVMNKNMKGINFIRTIYYIPSLIGGSIGIAILWKLMFQEEGIINSLLKAIHLPTLHWLGDPKTALPTIILLQLWTFGSSFVMFLAALKNVPADLYEAADIDGASSWKKFVKITLPQISSIIFFNIIMQTITALQSFTSSLVITNGGPLKSTYVLGMKLYTEAFSFYKMGYASVVKANADAAFKTAGLSANEYMSQVTSFSASLLSSLGGDTAKAAEVADMAMIDMADNANKFGTDMESIQNAYQGFAKQNYTMLDNLKLGYGGTQEEMQRLLQDASKISGVKYDISNLSDVYSAIHVIQNELGVTGTTAKEAGQTFSGSFSAMKAAAKNVLGN